jgi:hypothetical protein
VSTVVDPYLAAATAFCADPGDTTAPDWAVHAPFRAAVDAARAPLLAETERLRARIHEAVDDCQRRYAPYQKRCDRFDAIAKWARAEFGQAPWNDQHSWWDLTSVRDRTLIASIIEERDAANATIARVRAVEERYHGCDEYDFEYVDWDELQEALAGPERVPGA